MTGKTFIFLVISLLLVSGKGIANNDQTYAGKNILALFSLQPTTPAYRIILEGIHAELANEFGDKYTLQPEYLGMDQYPNGTFTREQFEPYNEKFRDVKIDLLICIGVNLAGTLQKYAEPFLLNLPTVSLDYDLSDYGFPWEISLNDKTVAIPLKFEIDKTIATMLSIFPETNSINIISGVSKHDQFFFSIAQQEAVKIDSSIKVEFFTNMSMAEILKIVEQMPDNSIIIVPRFSLDSKQVNYYNFEAIRLICRAANVPVFTYSSIGFGDGAVGGYIMNFEKVGLIVGEAAVRVLNGENPQSIKYDAKDYYEYMFDFRELNKWGLLGSKRIPKVSTIYFEEITFFDRYRWIFIGGVLFLLFQTLLIVRLIFLNRKQQLLTQQIRENETKYRELVREDRILRMGQLTASLSHELNQPLTSILSTAQAGIRFIDSSNYTPELLKEILQGIVEDDKRAASILSSIRGMMKLERKAKEKTNLILLVNEIISIYRIGYVNQDIELIVRLPDRPVYIFADRIQIQQVIMNLLSNATHSVLASKTDDKKIVMSGLPENGSITLSVRDYGGGIDPAIIGRIFKPFVTSKNDGMGIGLAISQTIIEDHEGKIWAENMPDGGAKFSFSLKIYDHGV